MNELEELVKNKMKQEETGKPKKKTPRTGRNWMILEKKTGKKTGRNQKKRKKQKEKGRNRKKPK